MHRLFVLLLALIIPLQFAWAAAATYCTHERGGQHFGHHEHKHDGSAEPAKKVTKGTAQVADADCEICQLGALQPLAADAPALQLAAGLAPSPPPHADWRSHVPAGLERPDRRLAA